MNGLRDRMSEGVETGEILSADIAARDQDTHTHSWQSSLNVNISTNVQTTHKIDTKCEFKKYCRQRPFLPLKAIFQSTPTETG